MWAVGIEPGRVVLRETPVSIARWPADLGPLRIAALADLHTGSPHITVAKLREIVASVNAAQPDLIVLLGDYVIHGVAGGRFVEIEQTAAALRDLKAPLGVFAVLGNHDWWYDGARCVRALEAVGIRVLEDAAAEVTVRGHPLWIAGVSDAPDPPGRDRPRARAGAGGRAGDRPHPQPRSLRPHAARACSSRWPGTPTAAR